MKHFAVLFLLMLAGANAGAQMFSTTSYMKAVFDNSPDLKAAQEAVQVAKSAYSVSLYNAALPSMSITANSPLYGFSDQSHWEGLRFNRNEVVPSAAVAWNLFDSGRGVLSVKVSRLAQNSAELNLKITMQSLALTALANYINLIEEKKLLDVAENNLKDQQAQHDIAKNLYDSGLQNLISLLQAETDMRSSQLRLAQAKAAYQQALVTFNTAINRDDPFAPATLDETVDTSTDALPSPEHDLASARQNRYEMLQQEIALRSADAAYELTKRNQLPEFKLDVSWTRYGLSMFGLTNTSSADPNPNYSLAATLNVPLGFFWLQQHEQIKSAGATKRTAYDTYEAERRTVVNDVVSARISLELNINSLDVATFMQQSAAKKLEVVQEQYKQGTSDSTQLSQAQSDLLSAQNSYTTALYQTALYRAQYRKAIGEQLWGQQ
jgi:outer membrane protein TolC